jgi:hypothetical protein
LLQCAAAAAAAGNSGPFWEMLVLLACCDKSTIVALEAIKGLAGVLGGFWRFVSASYQGAGRLLCCANLFVMCLSRVVLQHAMRSTFCECAVCA